MDKPRPIIMTSSAHFKHWQAGEEEVINFAILALWEKMENVPLNYHTDFHELSPEERKNYWDGEACEYAIQYLEVLKSNL